MLILSLAKGLFSDTKFCLNVEQADWLDGRLFPLGLEDGVIEHDRAVAHPDVGLLPHLLQVFLALRGGGLLGPRDELVQIVREFCRLGHLDLGVRPTQLPALRFRTCFDLFGRKLGFGIFGRIQKVSTRRQRRRRRRRVFSVGVHRQLL